MWNVKLDGTRYDDISLINTILKNRNITDTYSFLNPSSEDLLPLTDLKNIQSAANIVKQGLQKHKKFKIFFDVDNDGVMSGTIMYDYLRHFTDKLSWTVNIGKKHGVIEDNMKNYLNTDILIIVDSLNRNMKLYQEILKHGIDIIILDHHMIPKEIDTKTLHLVSSANDYKNPQLSGSGVVWKFCCYLDKVFNTNYAYNLCDLAASGIISDMCDVSDKSIENRYICDYGFNHVTNTGLKQINGHYAFNSQSISFGIAPLINASCRFNKNTDAVSLMLSNDKKEINAYIKQLKSYKTKQKKIVDNMMPNILRQVKKQKAHKFLCAFISDNCNMSGLIANKLLGIYKVPILILHEENNIYKGSARGIGVESFKTIVEQTQACKTAGHENAFGIEIQKSDFKQFIQKLVKLLNDITFVNKYDIDVQLTPQRITPMLIDRLKAVNRITGEGFKPINVAIKDISNYEVKTMSNGKHLKICSRDMDFIKWNYTGDINALIIYHPILEFVGTLDSNYFGGMYSKQLIINDFKEQEGG